MLKRGQAVLDYDAKNRQELSLMAHEVLNIYELSPLEEDFVLGERGDRVGKVPRAYIRIISWLFGETKKQCKQDQAKARLVRSQKK